MKIERTEDRALIKSIFDDPDIRPWVRDDGVKDDWEPGIHPLMFYLVPTLETWDNGVVSDTAIGMMLFTPVNSTCWNPHMAILPKYRGNGYMALRAGVAWMFANTLCLKLVAFPPESNPRMIHVFQKLAFRVEGHSTKRVLKDGVLHDCLCMGLEKGQFNEQAA